MKTFLIFSVIVSLAMTACARKDMDKPERTTIPCTLDVNNYRVAVVNSVKYRDEIRETFIKCQAGNTHRDVVYNDTAELAQYCKDTAYSLYGAMDPSQQENTRSILADVMKCEMKGK